MIQQKAKIIANKQIAKGYFKMSLRVPQIARQAQPGQFIHVRVSENCDPLLRRPFSIHRINPDLTVLYEIKGKGTEILSRRKKGESLDIIGPLGNGFSLLSTRPSTSLGTPRGILSLPKGYSLLVAGGMGVAPLMFLAEKLKKSIVPVLPAGRHSQQSIVLIGSQTKNKIMCVKGFKKLGCRVRIATEDGSSGTKGLVTKLLEKILATSYKPQATSRNKKHLACSMQPAACIYACGPKPMLAQIHRIANQYRIPAQVSLEEFMGCGLGACLGCAVKTVAGYKRVCKDGPVFNGNEIDWRNMHKTSIASNVQFAHDE